MDFLDPNYESNDDEEAAAEEVDFDTVSLKDLNFLMILAKIISERIQI